MNKLPIRSRKLIIRCLVEGQSIRATARTADVSKNTVTKLLIAAGKACAAYQDKALHDLPCERIQVDELWSFIYAKEKNVARAKSAPVEAGDVWTWTAICADTKLVPSWRVGDRSGETAIDFMAQRLREAWSDSPGCMLGPVEVDETFIGGKEKNKHGHKKLKAGRGTVGKSIVVGAKDRDTNRVSAAVVGNTDAKTLQGFVGERAVKGSTVFTDDHGGYQGMPFEHKTVKHSVGEYVNGMAHTNGIESFWALLKRGYHGTYHHMSEKHLDRYVTEFAGRHNARNDDDPPQGFENFRSRQLRNQLAALHIQSDLLPNRSIFDEAL